MQTKTFSEEQIVQILREAETGTTPLIDLCRIHGISETTFAPRAPEWRKKFGGADVSSIKRLRELEQENARLKCILAEPDLEVDVLTFCGVMSSRRFPWHVRAA